MSSLPICYYYLYKHGEGRSFESSEFQGLPESCEFLFPKSYELPPEWKCFNLGYIAIQHPGKEHSRNGLVLDPLNKEKL